MNKAEVVFEKIAKKEKKTWEDFLYGAGAGTVATGLTMPLENIQINQAAARSPYHGKPFTTVAKGLWQDKKLWAGTSTKLMKVAPTMGITFAVYELLKDKMNKR